MTSMRIRPGVGGRMRPGLLASAVVAIVLGILGMHGFDAHGVTMHGAMAHGETATALATGADERAVAHPGAHSQVGAADHDSGDAGGMGSMVMLCGAMLAAAAATVLGLLAQRARLPALWVVRQLAWRVWRPGPRILHVGTGPPSVWRFSVIRC